MTNGVGEIKVLQSSTTAIAYISHEGQSCSSPMWRARATREARQKAVLANQADIHCPACGTKGLITNFQFPKPDQDIVLEPGIPHSLVGNSYVPVL